MLKEYLKLLELKSKEFKKNDSSILDIVIYGSFVKGKNEPRDLDIILLFDNVKLEKRLDLAQDFKYILKKDFENLDVKSINIIDLFDKNFLARQGILLSGVSLIDNERLSEKLGFRGHSIYSYNLKNLKHNEKIKFNYALNGRILKGILKTLNGKSLGRGTVKIPIENSLNFEEFLKKWNIEYKVEDCLIPSY